MWSLSNIRLCFLLITLFQITTLLCAADTQSDLIVSVEEGILRGAIYNLVDGSTCYSFRGIPYAQPPVGNLRFTAPLPPKPWEGVRNAANFGSRCTQYNATDENLYQGSEDCLFLNVYTKVLDENAKIPVIVYIHGGSYYSGSGNFYLPDFLMLHDVIVVTLNYRLDIPGFLSLDIPEVPGNAGMKDQVAALRWIQKNIAQFGGDPNSVTIFGESSGASSVTHHMLSPMSKGLFHRAIANSGVSINEWAIGRGSKARAFRAGKVLGIDTDDVQVLLKRFRALNATALTNLTVATLTPDEQYRGFQEHFLPVVEKKFPNTEAFLDEDPISMLKKGKITKVPLMLGYNSAEGILSVFDVIQALDVYNEEPSYFVQREVAEKVSADQLKDFGERIKKFYFGDKNITADDLDTIVNLQTDTSISYNIHRFAHLFAKLSQHTYLYRFNLVTDLNIIKQLFGLSSLDGACHGDEIGYIFLNYLNVKPYTEQEKLREISFKVTKLWADFAKTGHPTPDNSSEAIWQPYTIKGKEYYKIEEPFALGYKSDKKRVEFWNSLFAEAGLPHMSN